jgi:2-dehydro-3-deoxyphosphogluconate aldolase / (4S)-4-hydroxy-2-oxoglutarate aldolase
MGDLRLLSRHRVIPVVALDRAEDAGPLGDALVSGGLPVAEVTFRTSAALGAINILAARGDMLVGAGTVLTTAQVDEAVDGGASYIVSPGLSRAVVERAHERGVPVLPGAVTPTEIQAALELGITTVKFFPASTSGGPVAISALAAPFVGVKFVPTGGVGPRNLADYLAIPSVLAVGGSWMVPGKAIRAGDFETVRNLTKATVVAVRGVSEE